MLLRTVVTKLEGLVRVLVVMEAKWQKAHGYEVWLTSDISQSTTISWIDFLF